MLNFYSTPKPRKNKDYWERLWERLEKGEIDEKQYVALKEKHEIELEKKRKYKRGEPIKTLEEMLNVLEKDHFVWMFGRPKTAGFVYSQQFATLVYQLAGGQICRAVKKEEPKLKLGAKLVASDLDMEGYVVDIGKDDCGCAIVECNMKKIK